MLTSIVRISAKKGRVHLQRFLISKVIYEKEKFSLLDLCTLFENQLWLEQKVQVDDQFAKKFSKPLEDLGNILKQINFQQEFTERALRRFSNRVYIELEGFYFPQRNYQREKDRWSGIYQFEQSKQLGKLKKFLPQVARIGKGYRDKGSAKNVAYDGSPTWQEVAAHRGRLYNTEKNNERKSDYPRTETRAEELLRKCRRLS